MATKLFVNLAVRDLKRSVDFFGKLGFSFDPRFTDENATCMIISDEAYVMLLVEPFFKTFTKKTLIDASDHVEVLVSISAESRDRVDEMIDLAFSLGAAKGGETQDFGNMYGRSFSDPDGHVWEVFWMDPDFVPQKQN